MLGSKKGVKRIAVVGLGKKDKDDKELTPAALEAVGAQVGARRLGCRGGVEGDSNQTLHAITLCGMVVVEIKMMMMDDGDDCSQD